MRYIATTSCFLFASILSFAQYWEDAGIEIDHIGVVNSLFVDSTDNTLYCTGTLVADWTQPNQSLRYAALNGGTWSLGEPLDNYATTFTRFRDTLFMVAVLNPCLA